MSNRRILSIAAIALIAVTMVFGTLAPAAMADHYSPEQCEKWQTFMDERGDKNMPKGIAERVAHCNE